MGVWLGPRGKPKYKRPPEFTLTVGQDVYTRSDAADYGAYVEETLSDGTVNWELAIPFSCVFRFSRVVPSLDVFLVGGGESGSSGSYNESVARAIGGNGGRGGAVVNASVSVQANTDYIIVIGESGQSTTGFGQTALSGGGAAGGTGAYVNDGYNSGGSSSSGGDGATAFGGGTTLFRNGYKYGAGGGGGAAKSARNYYERAASGGGLSGGGAGGSPQNAGTAGAENSGGGGGGGSFYSWASSGGSGGSGIIIIRNARS